MASPKLKSLIERYQQTEFLKYQGNMDDDQPTFAYVFGTPAYRFLLTEEAYFLIMEFKPSWEFHAIEKEKIISQIDNIRQIFGVVAGKQATIYCPSNTVRFSSERIYTELRKLVEAKSYI